MYDVRPEYILGINMRNVDTFEIHIKDTWCNLTLHKYLEIISAKQTRQIQRFCHILTKEIN